MRKEEMKRCGPVRDRRRNKGDGKRRGEEIRGKRKKEEK
jgi:hypothetical protein